MNVKRICALALACCALAGAAKVTTFRNATGYWSDAANWSDGVAGDGDEARFDGAVRSVTNDVDGLTIASLKMTGGGDDVVFAGKPLTVESGAFGLANRTVHFRLELRLCSQLVADSGSVWLHVPGSLPFGASASAARRLVFAAPEGQGAVTNVFSGGVSLGTLGGKRESRLTLSAGTGTTYRQEVGCLALDAGTMDVEPGKGTTLALYGLAVNGLLHNVGAGDVELMSPLLEGSVSALRQQNGSGAFVFKGGAACDANRPAVGAILHLDASDAASFLYKDGDPALGVVRWNGVNGAGYAYHDGCVAEDGTQVLPQRREDALNGRAVVDFGQFQKGYGAAANRAKGGYLILNCGPNADFDVWTAFVVECCQNFAFTSYHGLADGLILHGGDAWNQVLVVTRGETHGDFCDPKDPTYPGTGLGYARLNGKTVDAWSARLSGEDVYDALGMRATTHAIRIGRLAWDRKYRTGGAKIAEVILYSRRLTDAEFAATEAYLRNKWQNAGVEVAPLRERTVVPQLVNDGKTPFRVEAGAEVEAETFDATSAEARRAFTGGGTLALARATDARRDDAQHAVQIGDGTLVPRAAAQTLAAPETCPIADAYFHLDATVADSFTLEEDGRVAEWRDVTGNGRAARYAGAASGNLMPRRVEGLLNGRAGVDFGVDGSGMCLLWNHTNTAMKAVFLVYGTPGRGENFLLGDTYRDNVADFHRGSYGVMFKPDGYTAGAIKTGDVFVNGRAVQWNAHALADEPCVVAIATKGGDMRAAAFAVDRWGHPTNGKNFRTGGQQICEVVVYNRVLEAEERDAVQSWLIRKWLPRTPAGFALRAGEEQFDAVRSAAGAGETAAVDVPEGETARVGALAGNGLEKKGGGALVVNVVDDLEGTLTVAEGTVEVAARALPDGWEPPAGYVAAGEAVGDVRAVFAVVERAAAGTLPALASNLAACDVARIDGVRAPSAAAAACPAGRHVVSLVTGERRTSTAWDAEGGFLERLTYRREVTDLERRDIEAHLARKWGLAPLPGRTGATNGLARAEMAEGGRLKATGGVLQVSCLGGTAATLEGAVRVGDAGDLAGALTVPSGAQVAFGPSLRATADTIPQKGLIAHFDMSRRDTLETYEAGGTNFVTRWRDLTGKHVAAADPTNRPWILERDCNGLDALCTGEFCSTAYRPQAIAQAAWLKWDSTELKARTVIEVIGAQEGGSFVVTGGPGSPCVHRGGATTGASYQDALLMAGRQEPTGALYGDGAFFAVNGERVDPCTTGFPSADYHSVTVRVDPDFMNGSELGFFYIGTFGLDRIYRWGGQRVCEVLAYDRLLEDGEMAALEGYLQKKWFGRVYRDLASPEVAALALAGGVVDLGGDGRRFASVSGTGAVTGGRLNVTKVFAPAGLAVAGELCFAAPGGTIMLPVAGVPRRGAVVELGSAGGLAGDWASWTIAPLPEGAPARLVRRGDGTLAVYVGGAGTLLLVR